MEALLDAADAALRNPFDDEEPAASALSLLADDSAATQVATLLAQGRVEHAQRVVLGVAALHAAEYPEDNQHILPERLWTSALLRPLEHNRTACVRMALASSRCVRALGALHGSSAAMKRLRRDVWSACFGSSLDHGMLLERVVRDHDVLIVGETGTGKESVANAILDGTAGPADGTPAARSMVNAAALPETLVEGELFGYAKGAFTGATQSRIGRIRSANGGGFFLDEVGDLPLFTQAKLLRVIELDEVAQLGSDVVTQVDVRFIAATHRDLLAMVAKDHFRRDLYERLAGCIIRMPALRDRPEDIPIIGMTLVRESLPSGMERDVARIEAWLHSPDALRQHWPGNVRELHNVLRNLMLGLPAGAQPGAAVTAEKAPTATWGPREITEGTASLQTVDDWYMRRVLTACGGNHAQAARQLGIDRSTLKRKSRAW